METDQIVQTVERILSEIVKGSDVVIDDVKLRQRGGDTYLEVIVDRESGTEPLPLEEVAELSRQFSDQLDESDPIPGQYLLEVGTPGAERQLKTRRHYERNLGREIRVRLRDGDRVVGELCGVGPESFTLTIDGQMREIEFANVRKARPRVAFS